MPYDPYGADERRDSRYMDDDEYRRMREAGLPAALSYCAGAFMSAVSMTYILMADEGFHLGARAGYSAGLLFALALFAVYYRIGYRKKA